MARRVVSWLRIVSSDEKVCELAYDIVHWWDLVLAKWKQPILLPDVS
jgi:hypothetical protein